MKSCMRFAPRLVLACVTFLVAASAWAEKPMDYTRGPLHFGPFPFFDCTQFDGMDFWVWAEGDTMEVGKLFFDKDGVLTQAIGTSYTANALIWAPADPGCNEAPFAACFDPWTPMPGTATHSADDNVGRTEHSTAIYRDWIYVEPDWIPTWTKNSGLSLHIGIPGYGNIFTNAGTVETQLNLATFQWEVIKMTPDWNDAKIKDVFALCSYIGNQ
ncbi:MAG: hypothetical protein OES10_07020 [Gammaproteobacteria bacterium]|nr:hypothetical protein [Gammaproteobacteria bacterium]